MYIYIYIYIYIFIYIYIYIYIYIFFFCQSPKGGGVLAFMALASSPTGGNPSPRGMGSWPYGLDPILHWGTPPRGVASWPSWPWRHLPSGETHPHWGWGLGPMALTSSSLGEQSPKGGGVLAFMALASSPIGGNGVWRVA